MVLVVVMPGPDHVYIPAPVAPLILNEITCPEHIVAFEGPVTVAKFAEG